MCHLMFAAERLCDWRVSHRTGIPVCWGSLIVSDAPGGLWAPTTTLPAASSRSRQGFISADRWHAGGRSVTQVKAAQVLERKLDKIIKIAVSCCADDKIIIVKSDLWLRCACSQCVALCHWRQWKVGIVLFYWNDPKNWNVLFGPSDADTAAPMDLWIWTSITLHKLAPLLSLNCLKNFTGASKQQCFRSCVPKVMPQVFFYMPRKTYYFSFSEHLLLKLCVREGSSLLDRPLWWRQCFSRSLCQTCSRPPARCRHSGLHNSRSWGICLRSSAFLSSARMKKNNC